jgi:hypothetical protein
MNQEGEMTSVWKENLTWRSGLLSEIPVSRWHSIRGSELVEILIFKKRSDTPPHPGNLAFQQILQADSPPMEKSFLDNPNQFMCVAVSMGLRTIPVDCSFITLDDVTGSAFVHIRYKVMDSKKVVIGVEDVLAQLSLKCREAITNLAEKRVHTDISTQHIKEVVKHIKTDDLGLSIKDVAIPNPIVWPSGIVKPRSEIPEIKAAAVRDEIAAELKLEKEKKYAKLLENKLRSMGITHPSILMRVLSHHDPDYQVILEAAKHFADSQRDSQDKAREFLVWLIEKDKVPRIELEELITGLVGRVTDDVTALPDAVASLLTAPSEDRPRIADSSSVEPSITTGGNLEDDSGISDQVDVEQADDQEIGTPSHSTVRRRPPKSPPHSDKRERGHSYTRRQREPKQ